MPNCEKCKNFFYMVDCIICSECGLAFCEECYKKHDCYFEHLLRQGSGLTEMQTNKEILLGEQVNCENSLKSENGAFKN